ncbi:MAG: VanZ family protein [bacterium]|nr:VanZ family protein [bacterium]
MKKLRITLLVLYVLLIVVLIYESAIPESLSVKEHNFFKKIVNNISRVFVKTKYIDASEIVINNDLNEYYYINETLTLDINVKPDNASYKELSFISTNSNILTVDDHGLIEFLSVGNASVIIKQIDSNIEKQIDFKVLERTKPVIDIVEPDLIKLEIEKTTLNMGEVSLAKGSLYRSDNKEITDKKVSFSSTNESVANYYNGYLFAFNEGTTTITMTHTNTGLTSSVDITVYPHKLIEPTTFKISGDSLIYMNDKTVHNYSVEIKPDNVSDIFKTVFFSSFIYNTNTKTTDYSKNGGLSIKLEEGSATAKEAGYSAVYAYNYTFNKETNKIEWKDVTGMVVETRNVLPNYNLIDRRIVLGNPYKLDMSSYVNSNVTYSKFEYSSSDESIASIDSLGNITPHKKGKTTITVRLDDGYHSAETSFELTVDSKVMEDNMGRKSFSKFVRKGLSHFMGFVVFGLVSSFMFLLFINTNYDGNKKLNIVITIINGFVFASLTEFIQIFAIDRTAQLKDIAIDYLGYMLAVVISFIIISIIYLVKMHKQKSKENIESINKE